jgi:probable F420-dependent oxidoreductase
LGIADAHEQQAFGVERSQRAALFDEALAVLRGAWAPGVLTHHGAHFHYDGLRVLPKPTRQHLDVWLGGIAPSELRRVGRLADGWLPSFVTPDDAARGREVIEGVLAEHGRTIEADHYGVLIPFVLGEVPERTLQLLARRRPDLGDPAELVPTSWEALQRVIERFVAIGTSKFVIVPLVEPVSPEAWVAHLEEAAPLVQAAEAGV